MFSTLFQMNIREIKKNSVNATYLWKFFKHIQCFFASFMNKTQANRFKIQVKTVVIWTQSSGSRINGKTSDAINAQI